MDDSAVKKRELRFYDADGTVVARVEVQEGISAQSPMNALRWIYFEEGRFVRWGWMIEGKEPSVRPRGT